MIINYIIIIGMMVWILLIIKSKMNRIKLDIIKQSTSIPIDQLKQITQANPYSQGWLSQKFPIYPILLIFHISNPPFNQISLSIIKPYCPQSIILQGSADRKQYFKFEKMTDFSNSNIIVLNLKEHHHYKYLRLKILSPLQNQQVNSTTNVCKQVWIRCIQLSFVSFYGCQYVCNLGKALQLDPCLFRVLEMLQYRAMLAKNKAGKGGKRADQYRTISNKYFADIQGILKKMKQWKENVKKLSQQTRENMIQELQYISKEPMDWLDVDSGYDRNAIKKEVAALQSELEDFYVHRINNLHKDVTDYFSKYWNKQVKEEYMRLLSSPDPKDHGKALTNFWIDVKLLKEFPQDIEQAVVMYFNYFLEYVHDTLKISAIKILCLFFSTYKLSYSLYPIYQRLLFNLYSQLADPQREQLVDVSLKCIYTLFQKVPDSLFIHALLNPEHSVKFRMKLIELEILEKITFRNVGVDGPSRDAIVDFLLELLGFKEITLVDKNRAYNIIAYLSTFYGKDYIMGKFQKLNTMITMTMQKAIDKKMKLIQNPKQDNTPICEFCGLTSQSFRDTNLYDLHCFKECRYLTPCKYCNQVVQIPELKKHYIHSCQQRNIFKQCQECNEVIIKAKEDQHKKICTKELMTKCALCGQKMDGKLKLKEHILKIGCPNNPR